MNADLFLRKVPEVVRELIVRQATENRRSINQEAIALLEEALITRFEASATRRSRLEELRRYVDTQGGELDPLGAPVLDLAAAAAAPTLGAAGPRLDSPAA